MVRVITITMRQSLWMHFVIFILVFLSFIFIFCTEMFQSLGYSIARAQFIWVVCPQSASTAFFWFLLNLELNPDSWFKREIPHCSYNIWVWTLQLICFVTCAWGKNSCYLLDETNKRTHNMIYICPGTTHVWDLCSSLPHQGSSKHRGEGVWIALRPEVLHTHTHTVS